MASPSTALQAPALAAQQSFFDLLVAGGPVMIPIGVCSVIALACAVERALSLRNRRLGLELLPKELPPTIHAAGIDAGLKLCTEHPSPLSNVMSIALSRWSEPFLEREKAVEDAGMREVRRMGARLRPLTTVATVAPLLGLLGTVWGMVLAFREIGLREGLGRPEALADGISQALITTVAGLVVAIPAQLLFSYFRSRIDGFARRSEELYLELGRVIAERPGQS
jgi:biopolymer transport protein ExbB